MDLLRRLRPCRSPATHRIGRRGERAAGRWFRRRGYVTLTRRWRTPHGEIDLVVRRGREAWIVEVKSTARAEGPRPRIRAGQRGRLLRTRRWVARRHEFRGMRVGLALASVLVGGWRAVVRVRFNVHASRKPR